MQFGLPTVQDIYRVLEHPGRDQLPPLKTVTFKPGMYNLKDFHTDLLHH